MRFLFLTARSRFHLFTFVLFVSTLLSHVGHSTASSQPVPLSGFVVEDAFPGVSFTLPLQIVFFPPPDTRKLVVQKDGVVWLLTGSGTRLPTPFADLRQKVLSATDRGLLSVALDPDFPSTRWVYFLYDMDPDSNGNDNNTKGFSRVERYQASTSDPNVIDPLTQHILLGQTWSTGVLATEDGHNSGAMKFGTDKTLFVSFGDGAHSGGNLLNYTDAGGQDATAFGPGKTDPSEDIGAFRSQSLNSMNGKVLRLDKETGLGLPSNPFWDGNGSSDRSRVWVYGFRNPYRFAVRPGSGLTDPALSDPGSLYVGEVPTDHYEEINIAASGGLNFGWPCTEGPDSFGTSYTGLTTTFTGDTTVLCNTPLNSENPSPKTGATMYWHHTDASLSYPPGVTGKCATAGTFYEGMAYPSRYHGAFFFADYVSGWIRSIRVTADDSLVASSDSLFVNGAGGVVSIEADPNSGDLYFVDISGAKVYRIRYTVGNSNPVVIATISPSQGDVPLMVNAHASSSFDPNGDLLSYEWSFGNGDSSHQADTVYQYSTAGSYVASVKVSDGRGGVSFAFFNVFAGITPPKAEILSPANRSLFSQNDTLLLEALELDSTSGTTEYRWDIDLGHADHVHPSQAVLFGRTNSFVARSDNDGQRYYWRIRLSVSRDSVTVTDTVTVWPKMNVLPANLQFSPTNPTTANTVSVSAMVRSFGEVSSSEGFFRIREGGAVLATGTLPPVANGDSLLLAGTIGPLSAGPHTITFQLDPTDTLFETNESDNEVSGIITVQAPTDPDAIPFPAVLRDDFNAPNTSLAGRLKWVNIQSIPNGGSMAIVNNAIQATSTGGNGTFGGILWDSLMSGGTEATLVLKQKSNTSGAPLVYIYARMNNKIFTSGTGYRLSIVENSGIDRMEIHRVGPGYTSDVILAGINRELNVNDTVCFRVLADNQTLVARINGVTVLRVTDVIHTNPTGYFAIRTRVNATASRFDDFKVSSQPAGPPSPTLTVLSPNGGESWQVGTTQNITWSQSGLSSINLFYKTVPTNPWTSIQSNISASGGTYAWSVPNTVTTQARVRLEDASNPSTNDSSNAFFSIASAPSAPPTPILVSPSNMAANQPTTVTLSWNPASGASHYRVQLSSDSLFSAIILDDSTLTTSQRQTSTLANSTIHFWRVNARNVAGTSSWSATWRFTTTAPPPPLAYQPAVLRDDFNAANGTLPGRFKWQNIQNIPSNGSMAITNNAIQPSATGSGTIYGGIVWDSLMSAGSEMSLIVRQKTGGSGIPTLFIYARMNNKDFNSGTGYRVMLTENSGTDILSLQRVGPGYPNDVATLASISREINVNDTIAFRVLSNNQLMVILVNGQIALQSTDATNIPPQWYYALRARVTATPIRLDDFKVSPPSATTPSITLTSPNGGENWTIGSIQNITWTSSLITNVNLFYRTSAAESWTPIATGINAAGGSYAWTVPNSPSSQVMVRIDDASNSLLQDSSNAIFAISAPPTPSITILIPNGGQNWTIGTVQNITWSSVSVSQVNLSYKTSPAGVWQGIANNVTASSGSFAWTIPSSTTTQARVLIANAANPSLADSSDADFTISTAPPLPYLPSALRDDFNRANGALPGSSKWTNLTNVPSAASMQIVSNAIQPTTTAGSGSFGAIVWDSLMSGGSEVRIKLIQKSNVSGVPLFYLYARMNSKDFTTGAGYRLSIVENSTTDRMEIHRIGPGYTSDVMMVGVNRELNVNDTVTFRVHNDNQTMVALVNNQIVLQATDATNNASQWYFAIRARVNTTPVRLDDFGISVPATTGRAFGSLDEIERNQHLHEWKLYQNYPNPFNPSTTIHYHLPVPAKVEIEIFNTLGQPITMLANEIQSAGIHSLSWAGEGTTGVDVPSGIYFCRMRAADVGNPDDVFTVTQKLILIR